MKPINIIIAGLEKDVLSLAISQPDRFSILGYTDEVDRRVEVPYLGNDEDFIITAPPLCGVILPIDKPQIRKKLQIFYRKANFQFPNLISRDALLNKFDFTDLEGVIIQSGVYISSDVVLGSFVKLNVGAKVFHDSKIGSYSTLAPGSTVLGSCIVGEGCYLGANSILRNGINVESGITIGFGSVVTKSITNTAGHILAGNPARLMKGNENE